MAQRASIEKYGDGSVTLTNMRNNLGVPVFGLNETISATMVDQYWDGSPMDDSKVDGKFYLKLKKLPAGADSTMQQYVGKYFRVNLPNWGELFLEKDTMAEMRGLSSMEILLLKASYYKGVRLNGYYAKNDTPAPIEYYLSNTLDTDDEGSVVVVGDIKLEHEFKILDVKYFGALGDNTTLQTTILNRCLQYSKKVGGIEVIISDSPNNLPYLVDNSLLIPSYTTLTFQNTYVKASRVTSIGAIITMDVYYGNGTTVENVNINNPLVDANFNVRGGTNGDFYGDNCVGIAYAKDVNVLGGTLKNALVGTGGFGGKGVGTESGIRNLNIENVKCIDCTYPYFTQAVNVADTEGRTREAIDVNFKNCSAVRAKTLIKFAQSNPTDISKEVQSFTFTNILGEDITGEEGIISSSRGANGTIDGVIVYNKDSILVDSFIRGNSSNVTVKNAVFKGNLNKVVDSYYITTAGSGLRDLHANITVFGDVTTIFSSQSSNSIVQCNIDVDVKGAIANFFSTNELANTTSFYTINSSTLNKRAMGLATDINSRVGNNFSAMVSKFHFPTTSIGNTTLTESGALSVIRNNYDGGFSFRNSGVELLNLSSEGTRIASSTWNGSHLILGTYHFWINGNNLLMKNGVPASIGDGLKVVAAATPTTTGVVKQSASQANISQADLVAIATADGSDAATTQALANAIKAWINTNLVPLVNATKASQNTELTNQRTAEQQAP